MRIGFDGCGGDHGIVEIAGAVKKAVAELGVDIVLFGDRAYLEQGLEKEFPSGIPANVEIVHCSEKVENEDKPVEAIRRKKDSSLVIGFQALKDKKIDAFVTAGNTGAVLAGSIFVVGRIKGISRPAICTIYPTGEKPSVLLDAGANAECTARNLVDFAVMGSIYATKIIGYANPTVGLVNIGAEPGKGTPLHIEAHKELSENPHIHFVGNVEGRDVPTGAVNVLVADGFTGNIVLKLTEGVAKVLLSAVKESIMSSLVSKLGGLLIKNSMKQLKKRMDYTEYGGAPILGVEGLVVKAHGSSNAYAFFNAIRYAKSAVEADILGEIRTKLSQTSEAKQ